MSIDCDIVTNLYSFVNMQQILSTQNVSSGIAQSLVVYGF